MPELPDVEAMRLTIEPDVVGRTFAGVTLNWPRAVRHPSPGEFQEGLVGAEVTGLRRRAKYFLFDLDVDETLIIHLRMTGSLRVTPAVEPLHRYTQTIFHFADGQDLRFVDPRKFGAMWLVGDTESVLGGLGPEPLESSFTSEVLARILAKRVAPVKALLLEQELIAGIGNIYADDILFDAKVHPLRPGKEVSGPKVEAIHGAIQSILARAIETLMAGLPKDAPPTEALGMEIFMMPRESGAPCPQCGHGIERIKVRGRGTYFCPQCQPE
ncbi:MAG: bifunctional DNA-formamidopyrimidine glycosylase/DNA-(apurinic or apyrimidinic site) lyase [Chloroflexi bacterium]|nr:bifunctional DNA-formamidopyrimidine glycosylase/DNA-(apurinic or apyrimidinic site) lyase [Chloroflexota bacterium]